MHWRSYLQVQTQNPAFLWRAVIGILVGGLVISYVTQRRLQWMVVEESVRFQAELANSDSPEDAWRLMLEQGREDFPALLDAIGQAHRLQAIREQTMDSRRVRVRVLDLEGMEKMLSESDLASERKEVAEALWRSFREKRLDSQLALLASASPPIRYANFALAVFWVTGDQRELAARHYELEGRIPEASDARKRAVEMLLSVQDQARLRQLAEDPLYDEVISSRIRLEIKTAERAWADVWWLIPRVELERFEWGPAGLAAFAGLCWFLFAIHAGQVDSKSGARLWLCLAAILLGLLSIWVTDFLIHWQEKEWGLRESSDLVGGLRYFIAGVGLREEFSKMLLLLPLIPFLVRRASTLETLIVGACVGLGFAILENHHYFARTLGTSTLGRYLTANFFHMASTSLIGLAMVRGIRNPTVRGPEAVAWFALIVVAHGLYDAAIVLPDLRDYSIGSMIIFVLLAFQFFRDLRDSRSTRPETISLTATFLLGVSLLMSVTLIYISSALGLTLAISMLGPEVLSVVIMVYVFLREMPNSLIGR